MAKPKKDPVENVSVEASEPDALPDTPTQEDPVLLPAVGGPSSPPADTPSKDKPKRTRLFRNKLQKVIRSTRDRAGAIWDYVEYPRTVRNRATGKDVTVNLTRRLRRPGTGVVGEPAETEIEE